MYDLRLENARGEILQLSGNPSYAVTSVDGILPADAEVSTTSVSTIDGEQFNYAKTGKRNIVITVRPQVPVESNRIYLYKWITTKRWIRVYYRTPTRDVYADGYVEKVSGSLFSNPEELQISIICPESYFKNTQGIIQNADYTEPLFEFPFAIEEEGIEISVYDRLQTVIINNESDDTMGITIRLSSFGTVVNPRIYNRETLENIGLNFTMQESDVIEIQTEKGKKGVWLTRNGERTNIINSIMAGITWFQLEPGENLFTYEADVGMEFLKIEFLYNYIYGGV